MRPIPILVVLGLAALKVGSAAAQSSCPDQAVIDIHGSTDPVAQASAMQLIADCLALPQKTVRLGPDVDLNFETFGGTLPIIFGRGVTLTSVATFDTAASGSARTPHSLGPVLRYGQPKLAPDGRSESTRFLEVDCSDTLDGEGARISGFRLFGRRFGSQTTDEVGIGVNGCHDVEISNMEIAGWGAEAVDVTDPARGSNPPPDRTIHVVIRDSYLHHNQHPSHDDHAAGYGVNTAHGGYSEIVQNVFDDDRHAVAADGDAGGYLAQDNLFLKGGGYHGRLFQEYIHILDMHGTDHCFPGGAYNCGEAGNTFSVLGNAFQFTLSDDIGIRGKPRQQATIARNVFARGSRRDALDLQTEEHVVEVANSYDVDTFGTYGVCDIDGDGIDDLFQATGATWWFSSYGEFQWTYLRAQPERLGELRFGYFSGDAKCDVLSERPVDSGNFYLSRGGTGTWQLLGRFGHKLSEVRFGRFDLSVRDHRPGVTRPTTHAFWQGDGKWYVTPIRRVAWRQVQHSNLPIGSLQFGDFDGDGVTDVLAVVDGHWAYSSAGKARWRRLNAELGDPVENLFVANMDPDDNIDDLLRLDRRTVDVTRDGLAYEETNLSWWRSRNAVEPWRLWRSYSFDQPRDATTRLEVFSGFAGRFGAAPGGGTMVIDPNRRGHFYSAAETRVGASPDWFSLFPY